MSLSNNVKELWNYCNVVCDDAMGHGSWFEHVTHLHFLNMTGGLITLTDTSVSLINGRCHARP
jgi:hypothetical protein